MPRDDEVKDWSDAAASQGMPKTADEPLEAKEEATKDSAMDSEDGPADAFISDF